MCRELLHELPDRLDPLQEDRRSFRLFHTSGAVAAACRELVAKAEPFLLDQHEESVD
eukprot:CAMPEP_0119489338 /NCGR_PEP_ID=MMETSP1344-20130328/14820_1 /TAXON_ID=236787 /ORGANISM="Florenciella parvula, Strain CCMP2471" /LENGTH=56 /DNA_ID=CAMNT_0007524373 /DNA_START=354 /DNA_END=521 /DNA_ORIENTATION=-